VVFTGSQTAIGRVQQQVKEASAEEEATPLKKKLDDFGEKLANLIGVVCLLVWIMNYKNFFDEIHGSPVTGCIHYFKIAIALAVAAIPEGLPAVITTCLALGTRKMARNNAIVRRLPSVETLGCTSVICSDKTGTLTKNQMQAIKFAFVSNKQMNMKEYRVEGCHNAYDPNGQVQDNFSVDKKNFESLVDSFATGCTINNRSSIKKENGQYVRVGEPTEAALIVLAEKMYPQHKGQYSEVRANQVKSFVTLDFTSDRKAMSTVVTNYKNKMDLLIKGAPDRIIQNCDRYLSQENDSTPQEMSSSQRQQLMKEVARLSSEGLRCLAIAEVPGAGRLSEVTEQNKSEILGDIKSYDSYEKDAVFLGIVCIKDPVREEVKPAIQDCKVAGIRVIMITGDSKETATAIAQELDILEQGQNVEASVFTGDQFEKMNAAQR
jgi:Ca2+-transporting ATPase